MQVRVFELKDGLYREVGLCQEDGRYSGQPWLEATLVRLVRAHGPEKAARMVSTGLLEARLEG